jgi:hypothetical protein
MADTSICQVLKKEGRREKTSGDANNSPARRLGSAIIGHHNIYRNAIQSSTSSPKYDRREEHGCAALRLLERLRKAAREGETPSTADLQDERVYGLRPVNRIGDLKKGKHNGTRYDIERLDCGHGIYRWRLHEPARLGYPKNKQQAVLPLAPGEDWYTRQTGKPRPGPHPWKTAFSSKRLAESDSFTLTPPEPHP